MLERFRLLVDTVVKSAGRFSSDYTDYDDPKSTKKAATDSTPDETTAIAKGHLAGGDQATGDGTSTTTATPPNSVRHDKPLANILGSLRSGLGAAADDSRAADNVVVQHVSCRRRRDSNSSSSSNSDVERGRDGGGARGGKGGSPHPAKNQHGQRYGATAEREGVRRPVDGSGQGDAGARAVAQSYEMSVKEGQRRLEEERQEGGRTGEDVSRTKAKVRQSQLPRLVTAQDKAHSDSSKDRTHSQEGDRPSSGCSFTSSEWGEVTPTDAGPGLGDSTQAKDKDQAQPSIKEEAGSALGHSSGYMSTSKRSLDVTDASLNHSSSQPHGQPHSQPTSQTSVSASPSRAPPSRLPVRQNSRQNSQESFRALVSPHESSQHSSGRSQTHPQPQTTTTTSTTTTATTSTTQGHLRRQSSGRSETLSTSSGRTASPATKMRLLDLASNRALERDGEDSVKSWSGGSDDTMSLGMSCSGLPVSADVPVFQKVQRRQQKGCEGEGDQQETELNGEAKREEAADEKEKEEEETTGSGTDGGPDTTGEESEDDPLAYTSRPRTAGDLGGAQQDSLDVQDRVVKREAGGDDGGDDGGGYSGVASYTTEVIIYQSTKPTPDSDSNRQTPRPQNPALDVAVGDGEGSGRAGPSPCSGPGPSDDRQTSVPCPCPCPSTDRDQTGSAGPSICSSPGPSDDIHTPAPCPSPNSREEETGRAGSSLFDRPGLSPGQTPTCPLDEDCVVVHSGGSDPCPSGSPGPSGSGVPASAVNRAGYGVDQPDTADPNPDTADPNLDTADPNPDTADPNLDTADPNSDLAGPSLDTADPKSNTTDPNLDTADSKSDTADPNPDTADPNLDTADPKSDTADPNPDTADPNLDTADPKSDTADPNTYGCTEDELASGGVATETLPTVHVETVDAGDEADGWGWLNSNTADPNSNTADPNSNTADPNSNTADPNSDTADPNTYGCTEAELASGGVATETLPTVHVETVAACYDDDDGGWGWLKQPQDEETVDQPWRRRMSGHGSDMEDTAESRRSGEWPSAQQQPVPTINQRPPSAEGEASDTVSGHTSPAHRPGSSSSTPKRSSHLSIPSVSATSTGSADERSWDDDDNIDELFAKHRANSSLGVSRSSIGDSRESLASVYSDAGEINYGRIPVSGEITFGLDFDHKLSALRFILKGCNDLAAVDTKHNRSDPYVKVYLLPDKTRSGKRKSKIKKHTLNPVYNETLTYSISQGELENRTLWVTVWHNDRLGRNDFLGEVTIPMDTYRFGDSTPQTYTLEARMPDTMAEETMQYKGDLEVSLMYVTPDKATDNKKAKGKSKKSKGSPEGQGEIHALIKSAKNLTAVHSNGTSNPFVKGYLLPDRGRTNKQKTPVVKNSVNPMWNHILVFDGVDAMEIADRSLELTVWDHEKLGTNEFLGGARLNLGLGTVKGGQPVEWMDGRGEEAVAWQKMMERPNSWIDARLPLRPSMGKAGAKK